MKWNTGGQFQRTRKGTTRAREYYFVTTIGAGGQGWLTGYYGFKQQIIMKSAGTFATAQQARAYCEQIDREAVLIEAI